MESIQMELMKRLEDRTARVAVLGLGYVGLPLAVVFAEAGFSVVGIDPDERKVAALQQGQSYVLDVPSEQVARLTRAGRLSATRDFSVVAVQEAKTK